MTKETVSIPKDEYIDLLHSKSLLMEKELATAQPVALAHRKPHSWMSHAEKAEIFRLAGLGFRPGEIGREIGRPVSTISRCLRRQKTLLQGNSEK